MGFTLDLPSLLVLFGVAQGGFLAGTLCTLRRGRRGANVLLALLVGALSYVAAIAVLYHTGSIVHLPHLVGTHTPLAFVGGPLIHLYVRVYVSRDGTLHRRDALHFVPVVAYIVYLLPIYALPAEIKIEAVYGAFIQDGSRFQRVQTIHMTLVLLHVGGYMALAWRRVSQLVSRSSVSTDADPSAQVQWLRMMLTIGMGMWTVMALRFLVDVLTPVTTFETILVLPASFAFFSYALGYLGLRHTPVLRETNPISRAKYAHSSLRGDEARRLAQRIIQLMDKESIYTDAGLTLDDVADQVEATPHHVSEVLNTHIGKSFSEVVNARRVEAAKERLADPESHCLTVAAIAQEVGFSSRSAFYAAFKKHDGRPPSSYRSV